MVCLPKEEGGLGVIDLGKHNEALLLKNLEKFFNHKRYPLGLPDLGKTLLQWQTSK
jgi:hypothetical protein